ncbi:MAG: RNB domain-containing ribonuclease [Cyanobacteriota bacterium]|nr:RNB domain-containing ribonuclease [Cyanobacteriota bacterium]
MDGAPWRLSRSSLLEASPSRRAWGAAWLLLLETGETPGINDFSELVCGGVAPVQLAACWLELVGGQHWFRWRQRQVQPRHLSELRSLRRDRHRRELLAQRQQAWLDLLRRRQSIDVQTLSPEHQGYLLQLKAFAAGSIELDQLDESLRHSLSQLQGGRDRGSLRHLLVDLGQWDAHHLVSMIDTPWSRDFTCELQDEAERLMVINGTVLPGDAERLDLTHQRCVTIDDLDTLDLDDGLALELRPDGGQRLWIHVADPGRLIEPESPLDLEARRRGSSLYLAAATVPMFPQPLAIGPLSLRSGERCAAWSTWVELDARGEIAAYGLQRSWVQPRYRLSYDDADELLDLAPPEEADLAQMDQLLQRRRAWRVSQGALLLDLPEGRVRCREGEPVLEITEPSPARQMVAEAMILAGAVAARYGREHQLALPYRSQLPADLPPAAELAALPDGAVRFAAIKRCLSRGLLGTQPAPHYSLGLPAYVQATSPIRRYGDLLVQRQLQAQCSGQTPLSAAQLQERIEAFESATRQGLGIAREDQRHWQQVWFEAHRKEQWRGQFLRWLRHQDRLGLVRIDALAMDLVAEAPPQANPGMNLLLRVLQVDPLRDQLKLIASPG